MFDHRQQILDKGGVCYELLMLVQLINSFFALVVSIVKFARSADSSRSDLY